MAGRGFTPYIYLERHRRRAIFIKVGTQGENISSIPVTTGAQAIYLAKQYREWLGGKN